MSFNLLFFLVGILLSVTGGSKLQGKSVEHRLTKHPFLGKITRFKFLLNFCESLFALEAPRM